MSANRQATIGRRWGQFKPSQWGQIRPSFSGTQFRGKRIKTSHRTKAEARAAKAARQAGERPASRERFEVYAERWLIEYTGRTARGLAPSTRAAYAWLMRTYVIPYFRGVRMGDIGPLDVKRFVAHLGQCPPRQASRKADRLAGSTVRRIMTPLKAMLAEAYEFEVIRIDAARVRVIVAEDRKPPPPQRLNAAQVAAVASRVAIDDRVLVQLLSKTGLRIGEALGLKWRDIEATDEGPVLLVERQSSGGVLRDEAKTARGRRRVALVPSLAADLGQLRARTRFADADAPIFASRTGTHQDSHNVRRRLRPAARAAGVPWATPHTFRHTLASELLERGYDSSVVAQVLGHSSDSFTRRVYIHTREVPRFDDIDA